MTPELALMHAISRAKAEVARKKTKHLCSKTAQAEVEELTKLLNKERESMSNVIKFVPASKLDFKQVTTIQYPAVEWVTEIIDLIADLEQDCTIAQLANIQWGKLQGAGVYEEIARRFIHIAAVLEKSTACKPTVSAGAHD